MPGKASRRFLEPQREVLVAHDSEQVADYLQRIDAAQAQAIGARARQRLLRDHTYTHRAREVEALLDARQREAA